MRFSPLQKLIAHSVLWVFIVGALGWFVVRASLYIQEFRIGSDEIETKLTALDEERVAARQAVLVLAEREGDLARLKKSFVDRREPVGFIEALESIARRTNNVIALAINESQSTSDALRLQLTIDGTQAGVETMLRLIELAPYQITIEEFSLQKNRSGTSEFTPVAPAGKPSGTGTTRLTLSLIAKTL